MIDGSMVEMMPSFVGLKLDVMIDLIRRLKIQGEPPRVSYGMETVITVCSFFGTWFCFLLSPPHIKSFPFGLSN